MGGAKVAQAAPKIIPAPQALHARPGQAFELTRHTRIVAGSRRAQPVAAYLARLLRRSTGYALPVSVRRRAGGRGAISLRLGAGRRLGREGYRLSVTRRAVLLRAHTPEGLFRGVQTLRQLLPAKVESASEQPGPWRVQGARIADRPRFGWRGAHLDVSRHFFSVDEVKRYIDLIAASRSTCSTCT